MIQIKKTILTLVALLAVTGAWATDVYLVGNGDGNWLNGVAWDPGAANNKMTEQNGVYSITFTNVDANPDLQFKFAINGSWEEFYGCSSTENELNKTNSNIEAFGDNIMFGLTEPADVTISFNPSEMTYMISTKGMKVGDDAASGPDVAWNKATKTGMFTMPGGNVELEPEYYPQAALTAAPTAINDVPATTDGAIVKAGTVKNIGETTTAQGTVMYYVSPTALDDAALLALAADQWTADVPTAESLAQGQAYVYYYVRGNDSDTDEENFSDGDILAANALAVTIAAEPTYAVTFAEGTEDAGNWTIEPAEAAAGSPFTATYSGEKKVKSVKAVRKAVIKPDLLSGVFSVSSTKKVNFSKGNLRYSSSKWSFFDNQYFSYESYSEDACDHFGWSTSANTYGMNTSKSNSDYSGDFVDWGATMGTGWFTLSSDEWTYLFNTRSASTVGGTADGRYAKAKINNVMGVILFPDTYTHPDGVTAPTNVNTANASLNSNTYTVADWTKMESAGCVFLPTAGYRDGSMVRSLGTCGYYWSATPNGTDNANYMYFGSDDLTPAYNFNRYYGYSVRLVREVNE